MTRGTVLVTGGGGFVGRSLVDGFAGLGWDVVAVDRAFRGGGAGGAPESGATPATGVDDRVRRITLELAEVSATALPPADLVIHGAWMTSGPDALGITAAEYVGLNLRPLMTLLEYVERARPKAFVFLSSSGVFSVDDGAGRLTDTDQPTGRTPYAASKRAGELLVEAALDARSPTPASSSTAGYVVRLGYLFGPLETPSPSRAGVSLVARWIDAAREGSPLEVRSDDPLRDWTLTLDLAAALGRVVGAPPVGRPIHLGSPRHYRDSQVAAAIAGRFPGAQVTAVDASDRVKAPMVPSDVPALADFGWTDLSAGLDLILGERVAT